ncbi:hypothetical protein ACFX2J_037849 [Malus domestica]
MLPLGSWKRRLTREEREAAKLPAKRKIRKEDSCLALGAAGEKERSREPWGKNREHRCPCSVCAREENKSSCLCAAKGGKQEGCPWAAWAIGRGCWIRGRCERRVAIWQLQLELEGK